MLLQQASSNLPQFPFDPNLLSTGASQPGTMYMCVVCTQKCYIVVLRHTHKCTCIHTHTHVLVHILVHTHTHLHVHMYNVQYMYNVQ